MSSATIILVGNLGRDPEVKGEGNKQRTTFSIATSVKGRDDDGNGVEKTTWWNVVVFGKQGENCARYLAKGKSCQVIGDLEIREYTTKDGSAGRSNDVVAQKVTFLGSKGGGADRSDDRAPDRGSSAPPEQPRPDDGIPF